jgi:CheY-like chemotaxis protein
MTSPKKILIVEDEAMVAEDLKEIVSSLGYAVAGMADNSAFPIESFFP